MVVGRFKHVVSRALRTRWYWLCGLLLTLLVWLAMVGALYRGNNPAAQNMSQPYGLTTGIENRALDLLFQLRNMRSPAMRLRGLQTPVVIVGIDDKTILQMRQRRRGWPRSYYARIIDRASSGGATAIGLDMLLSGSSGTSKEARHEDEDLVRAIKQAGNVVIGEQTAGASFGEQTARDNSPAVAPDPMFANAALAIGSLGLNPDSDGVIRSVPMRWLNRQTSDWSFSFAMRLVETHRTAQIIDHEVKARTGKGESEERAREQAAQVAMQEAVITEAKGHQPDQSALLCGTRLLPLRPDGLMQLDFRARSPAFRFVPAWKLLQGGSGDLPYDIFRDCIVLVAHTTLADGDLFLTPYFEPQLLTRLIDPGQPANPVRTPGVEIHATAIATMIDGTPPDRPGFAWEACFLLCVSLPSAFALLGQRTWLGLGAVILTAGLVLALSLWFFQTRAIVLPLATAWIGLALLTPLTLALRHARESSLHEETERQRTQMMDIFSRCVSPEVAEALWRKRDQVSLAGELRFVTIVFTDVRNFTPLSELSTSEEVVEWLSEYFTRMNTIVTSHGGHISKFIGDGLMIVFGAPLARSPEVEARSAVECGVAMLDEVERINQDWIGTRRPHLRIGVGIHSGEATCGVVGSPQRLEYTIIGDTVNVAARLESKTKDLNVSLLLSSATAKLLDSADSLRSLGPAEVKGKSEKIEVYTVERDFDPQSDIRSDR